VSILDRIRRLFGGEEIPEDAARIYRASRSEREALDRFEAERRRAHRHRETLMDDVRALAEEEEQLLGRGRAESSAVRRRLTAKQVAEVRSAVEALLHRVDLLSRRIALFDRQTGLIRDRAVLSAPLPALDEVERTAGDTLAARRAFEEVEEASELATGITRADGVSEAERRAERDLAAEQETEISFEAMLAEEEARLRPRRTDERSPEAMEE
jgi:23S rRNA maturation mini-RNase III